MRCSILFFFSSICVVTATEHFVSPAGDDAASGNREAPWRSIAKACEEMTAGDTVTLLPGVYPETLAPKHDGTSDAPIVFRSSKPGEARVSGGNPVVSLIERRHVVLVGLTIMPEDGRFLQATDCENLVIRNCRFEGSRGNYTSATLDRCRDTRIEDCVFDRHLSIRHGAVLVGNMIQANHCDGLSFLRNRIGRVGHSPAHLRECTRLVIRGNIFCAKWGRGFETFNATPMLFEENIVTEEIDSGGSADSRGKIMAIGGIVRRNLVFRNYDMALASNSYIYQKCPAWVLKNTRIYHNTFYHNHTYAWIVTAMKNDLATVSGNIWLNNMFCDNDPLGDGRQIRLGYLGDGNRFVRNILCGSQPGAKVVELLLENGRYGRLTVAEAEAESPELFLRNLDQVPHFVDADADDFRLAPGSPGIDAGEPLAYALADGEGTEIPVSDATAFYDGFGLPGEKGDVIWVGGPDSKAVVVKVGMARDTLVVDRALRWKKGTPITLPYHGDGPDIGAYEQGAEGSAWYHPLRVPGGLRWQPPSGSEARLVDCDFRNETIETWGYVWNLDRKRNTDYKLVQKSGPADGNALHIFATDNRAILAADVKPPIWEIDAFPWIQMTYRIPVGVPVGVWLDGFDTVATGATRVCVGGTAARKTNGVKDLKVLELLDDDQWHTAVVDAGIIREEFPGLTHLQAFQFYTGGNATKGQGFLLGSFFIDASRPLPR